MRLKLISLFVGIVYVTTIYRTPGSIEQSAVFSIALYGSLVLLFFLFSWYLRRAYWASAAWFGGGTTGGTVIDLWTNPRFSSRNFFPLEILLWWIILVPCALIGVAIGYACLRAQRWCRRSSSIAS